MKRVKVQVTRSNWIFAIINFLVLFIGTTKLDLTISVFKQLCSIYEMKNSSAQGFYLLEIMLNLISLRLKTSYDNFTGSFTVYILIGIEICSKLTHFELNKKIEFPDIKGWQKRRI